MNINFCKPNDINAPVKSHPTDAGWDLSSAEDVVLTPGERKMINTGISIETPLNHFAMITPRSGLAAKHGITIVNSPGIIDAHYRGLIKVILWNTGDQDFVIKKNDRIAQLIIMPYAAECVLSLVDEIDKNTDRGTGGFGSTGK